MKEIKPENRRMKRVYRVKAIGKFRLNGFFIGTDGRRFYIKTFKPVKISKDDYELQEAWYIYTGTKHMCIRRFIINDKIVETTIKDILR